MRRSIGRNKNDVTPTIACIKGHVDVARLLLEKGAEVDRANKKTPLHIQVGT